MWFASFFQHYDFTTKFWFYKCIYQAKYYHLFLSQMFMEKSFSTYYLLIEYRYNQNFMYLVVVFSICILYIIYVFPKLIIFIWFVVDLWLSLLHVSLKNILQNYVHIIAYYIRIRFVFCKLYYCYIKSLQSVLSLLVSWIYIYTPTIILRPKKTS